jgi:hypothetical protein
MPALTHTQPGTVELLERLQIVERRLRYLGLTSSVTMAQRMIEDIAKRGVPARLYVNWTAQLEDRADRKRAERNGVLVGRLFA